MEIQIVLTTMLSVCSSVGGSLGWPRPRHRRDLAQSCTATNMQDWPLGLQEPISSSCILEFISALLGCEASLEIEMGWAGYGAHACNPRIREAEAGRLQVPGQPGLHSELVSQKRDIISIYSPSSLFSWPLLSLSTATRGSHANQRHPSSS
jgi:hypothetical protein